MRPRVVALPILASFECSTCLKLTFSFTIGSGRIPTSTRTSHTATQADASEPTTPQSETTTYNLLVTLATAEPFYTMHWTRIHFYTTRAVTVNAATTMTYITVNPTAPTQSSGYRKNWPSRAKETQQSGFLVLAYTSRRP